MKIPDIFRELQKEHFQDKEIAHRKAVKSTGSLGSVTTKPGDMSETFKVNFQILSDAVLAKDWGLVAGQDALITCSDRLLIENNDYVQYDDKVYKVVGKLQRDSHDKLMLKLTSEKAV